MRNLLCDQSQCNVRKCGQGHSRRLHKFQVSTRRISRVRRQVLARWPGGYAFKNITQPGILDRLSLVAGSERSPNRARVCVPYSQSLYRFTQPYPRPASGALTDAEAWKGLRFIDTRRSEDENHSSSKRG